MRNTYKKVKKNKLLFAATSSWGKRPQMIECISNKFSIEDFDGHSKKTVVGNRYEREEYYRKLGFFKI
jgi:hypothetical protein